MTNQGINIEEIKRKLEKAAAEFRGKSKSKLNALEPLKEQIIQLKEKGATNSEISDLITQSGLEVSKDTLRRYVATLGLAKGAKKRREKGTGTTRKGGEAIATRSGSSEYHSQAKTPEGFNLPPNTEDL